jgi:hypothetical protein
MYKDLLSSQHYSMVTSHLSQPRKVSPIFIHVYQSNVLRLQQSDEMNPPSWNRRKCFSFVGVAGLLLFVLCSLRLSLEMPRAVSTSGLDLPKLHPPEGIITKNVAAIIENGPLEKIVPLLLHFSSVLGPRWPIILFTSQDIIPTSSAFHRAIDELRISVRFLPHSRVYVSNHQARSSTVTKTWFWEQLAPAEHVLLFQSDSILCANSHHRIEDFLEYDFVGTPILEEEGVPRHGGQVIGSLDSGLSLRNRSMVLDIIKASDFETESGHANNLEISEDQWFYQKMLHLPLRPDGRSGAKLPSVKVATIFSVDTIWHDTPLAMFADGVLRRRRRWIDGALNTDLHKAAYFPRMSRGICQNKLSHCQWFLPGPRSLQQIEKEGMGKGKRYCSHRF